MNLCPKCGETMEQGFCHRASGLGYIRPEKFQRCGFVDEDLVKAGFRRLLPSKAEYYVAFLCEECSFFAVDFERSLNRREADGLAVGA